MIDTVAKMLRPLRNSITNMVARAVVQLVNDGAGLQVVQLVVGPDETRDGCERFGEYGLTSVPLAGAEAVALFVGGRRDHALVVAVDDRRCRPQNLQPGEVALYNDSGLLVLLKSDRAVLTAPEVRLGGEDAANYVALANLVHDQLVALKAAIKAATITAGDGGAAFQTSLGTALANWPASVAAGKVKAE